MKVLRTRCSGKVLGLAMGAVLALATGASAQDQRVADDVQQPDSWSENARRSAGNIASQPVRDIGASRSKLSPVLISAMSDPYSLKGLSACADLKRAIADLNEALGPDFTGGVEVKENRAGRLAQAGGKTLVNSIIPFRGLVREISGAAPAQRRLGAATDAGFARRGFLRGTYNNRACDSAFTELTSVPVVATPERTAAPLTVSMQ